MSISTISKPALDFLKKLSKNNNREWFTEHKGEYKKYESDVKGFFNDLKELLELHDDIETKDVPNL